MFGIDLKLFILDKVKIIMMIGMMQLIWMRNHIIINLEFHHVIQKIQMMFYI